MFLLLVRHSKIGLETMSRGRKNAGIWFMMRCICIQTLSGKKLCCFHSVFVYLSLNIALNCDFFYLVHDFFRFFFIKSTLFEFNKIISTSSMCFQCRNKHVGTVNNGRAAWNQKYMRKWSITLVCYMFLWYSFLPRLCRICAVRICFFILTAILWIDS